MNRRSLVLLGLLAIASIIRAGSPHAQGEPGGAVPIDNWWIDRDLANNEQEARRAVEALADMAADSRKVLVVGEHPASAEIAEIMSGRLGELNVTYMPTLSSPEEISDWARTLRVDRVMGVPDRTGSSMLPGHRTLTLTEEVKLLFDRIDLVAKSLEYQGVMSHQTWYKKHLSNIPVFKWDKEVHGWGHDQFRVASDLFDMAVSMAEDMDTAAKNPGMDRRYLLLNSSTLETVARRWLIDFPTKTLMGDAFPTSAIRDLQHVLFRVARDGRYDIESIELTCDAVVGVLWGGIGWLQGGNLETAKAYEELAVTGTKVIRKSTENWSGWKVMHQYAWFGGAEYRRAVENLDRSFERLEQTRARLNLVSYTDPGNPRPCDYRNAQTANQVAKNAGRTVVYGHGPVAEKTYRDAVRRHGGDNVQWIHSFPSTYDRQRIARDFRADAIIQVRHESYHEITERGVTRREPIRTIRPSPASSMSPPGTPRISQPTPPSIKIDRPISTPPRRPDPYHDLAKYAPAGGGGGPGPGSIPSSFHQPSSGVGGVMLRGSAELEGGEAELASGDFSLIFDNGEGDVDIRTLRMFVTALWAVYFSEDGPGISIDPIADDVDKHLVRYIGHVVNSDLGRVMRQSDYLMKKWAVGTERPDVPGFRNPDDIAGRDHKRTGGWSRFWFVPEDMTFRKSGGMLLYDGGDITLKTECMFENAERDADSANEQFAEYFTEHYWQLAEKYPVYGELFEYAKLVSLAKYLKEHRIPMLWFLLSNREMVSTENSPGTVDELVKKSDYFRNVEIKGGVDLDRCPSPNNYVLDDGAIRALRKAADRTTGTGDEGTGLSVPSMITFETDRADFSLTPSENLAISGSPVRGETNQTDFVLYRNEQPYLELTRYYNPDQHRTHTFGDGWHLMIPFEIDRMGDERIRFRNALIPRRMAVHNLLTGEEEILTFSESLYSIAGYVPDDPDLTNTIGLFPLSDTTLRLADKLGSEYQFDEKGRLTDMLLTDWFSVSYEYGTERIGADAYSMPPYRIEPVGLNRSNVWNASFPTTVRLIETERGEEALFSLESENPYDVIGYLPVEGKRSQYAVLAILSDASFLLQDRVGNRIAFDPAGEFQYLDAVVVRSMARGDHFVEFRYDDEEGRCRVDTARVRRVGESETAHTITYRYGLDGRLASVLSSSGSNRAIAYDDARKRIVLR